MTVRLLVPSRGFVVPSARVGQFPLAPPQQVGEMNPMAEDTRADKWLWAVRLFKTRALAAEVCASGKVRRRGHPLKASSGLKCGDELEVPYPEGPGTRCVRVIQLIEKRLGAPEACACYIDETSQEVINQRAMWHQSRVDGTRGRPTKKDRRSMGRIRGFLD